MKKRTTSDTEKLARMFVMDFLGREGLDRRRDGMHLKHAKLLVNPDQDANGRPLKAYTVDRVILALQAMTEGVFHDWGKGDVPHTMLYVLYHDPPFIERLDDIEKYIPQRPPFYLKTELRQWNERYAWLLKDK